MCSLQKMNHTEFGETRLFSGPVRVFCFSSLDHSFREESFSELRIIYCNKSQVLIDWAVCFKVRNNISRFFFKSRFDSNTDKKGTKYFWYSSHTLLYHWFISSLTVELKKKGPLFWAAVLFKPIRNGDLVTSELRRMVIHENCYQ